MKFFKIKVSNRIKWLVGGLLVIIVLPYLAYQGYITYFVKPYFAPVLKQRISEYEFIEDGKAIVVKWDYDNSVDYWLTSSNKQVFSGKKLVGKTKIVKDYKKIKGARVRNNIPEEMEYWGITVYDTQNQTLTSKDYDIFKMVRDYDTDYMPISLSNEIYTSGGKEVLDLYIQKIGGAESSIRKSIDLNSGKIVEAGDEQERDKEYSSSVNLFTQTNLLSVNSDYSINSWRIRSSSEKRLPSDTLIWTKYPKAAEIFSKNDSMIALLKDITSLEDNLPLLQLLVKDGTNLFEDVRIPTKYSVDGQEHTVNSLEEFKQYYDLQKDVWKRPTQDE
ncbi:hypothetical protein [Streptococcus sinensis]|uniref:hypothetical protein n=1 Tax=Streptococcus sinensis TaxID=176090 RepID=UPI00272A3143|nr:hypothetical protein [Streptococcus sinensis]